MSEETILSQQQEQSGGEQQQEQQQQQQAPPTPFITESGEFVPDWHMREGFTELPDKFKQVKNLSTVFGTLKSQDEFIAKQGLELGELRKGAPAAVEAPETYAFQTKPEDMPDEQWSQEAADEWAGVFKEHGISDEVASKLIEKHGADTQAAQQLAETQKTAELENQLQGLKEEWGNKYDENLESAQNVASKLGLDMGDPVIGNNIPFIKAIAKIGESVGESVIQGATPGHGVLADTASQLAEATAIMQDSSNPQYAAFHDQSHPQHLLTHEKVDALLVQHTKQKGGT